MESFGQFKILERLGAGSLGELFRAFDTAHGRTVALRVIDPGLAGDPDRRPALLADARAVLSFDHPHVAALLEVVENGDRLALAHEYIVGQPLDALIAGRPLDPLVAISIAAQVAEALGAATAHGLTHRALDPGAIIVTTGDQAKVLDFGLARWTRRGQARARAAGAIESEGRASDEVPARAACYVSPEQALGAPGDARSDVFALGVIFYEMLTGEPPFVGATAAATALKIVQAPALPPSSHNPAVSVEADAIAARALAKSLDARYADGKAMAADLRALRLAIIERTTVAERRWVAEGTGERAEVIVPARRPRSVRRWLVAACWLVALAAAAATAWYFRASIRLPWQAREVPPPPAVVLVLPFTVAPGGQDYMGPGVAEDVAARLGEVPGTSVLGRTSIRASRNGRDWRTAARKLGAAVAVGASLRSDPLSLEANVQMFDVANGAMIWSQRFQREARQSSALASEIAAQIAKRLGLSAPTSNRWLRASVRQIDPAAYDLYLQGRDAADRRDRSRAITLYDEALQREPRLIEARAALANALYLEDFYAGSSRDPGTAGRALREAETALAADAELPAAHLAAALASPTVTQAASSLARALGFDPSNGEAWHHAGDLVAELDPERAITFYRASLALEPAIDANWRDISGAFAQSGKTAEAERALVSGEVARPDRPWWKQMRARFDIERQRPEGAIAALLSDPSVETTPIVWLMGRVVPLALAGRGAESRREAARLVERYPAFCEGRAVLAGLEIDGGDAARGRSLATAILEAAGRPDAEPGSFGCAAFAAAGIGDAAEAASWLSRVAGDERALRSWTRQAIFGLRLSFRLGWYPWTKVAASQPVKAAAAQLDESLVRLRAEVERRLPVPPTAPAATMR